MSGIFTQRPRQIPNEYWQPGQPIGAPVSNFRQIKYLPLPNAVPDLDQALSEARLDCGRDLHKQLIEFGGAAKVWMTIQVEYEVVNPLANTQPFERYLSAAPTRMFRRDETISTFGSLYIYSLRILTDRIRKFNAKFIRDKSCLDSTEFENCKVRASRGTRMAATARVSNKEENNNKYSKR